MRDVFFVEGRDLEKIRRIASLVEYQYGTPDQLNVPTNDRILRLLTVAEDRVEREVQVQITNHEMFISGKEIDKPHLVVHIETGNSDNHPVVFCLAGLQEGKKVKMKALEHYITPLLKQTERVHVPATK